MNDAAITRARQLAASAAGLGAAGLFWSNIHDSSGPVFIPVGALTIAAVAAQLPWLGAQLLARGLWWSNMLLGVLFCVLGSYRERFMGVEMTLLCALALLVADRKALARAALGAGFRPTAYLSTLQLMMVLALGDAQTLGLFAALGIRNASERVGSVWFSLGALGLMVGFVGLYRVSLWGVFTVMGTALCLALAILGGAIDRLDDLGTPLLVGCAVQLVVPLPMLISMALKRPLPSLPGASRGIAASAAVVLVSAAAVAAALLGHR